MMYEQFWDVLCVNDKVDSDYDELGIFFFFKKLFYRHKSH